MLYFSSKLNFLCHLHGYFVLINKTDQSVGLFFFCSFIRVEMSEGTYKVPYKNP